LQSALKEVSREYDQRPMLDDYLAQALDDVSDQAEVLLAEEDQCFQELADLKRLYYQEKRYLQQIEQQRYITSSEIPNTRSPYAPLN
jgi:DNA primase